MPWIHIAGGEKGGVGKSLVSFALIQYYLQQLKQIILCEADRSNGDVGRAFDGKITVTRPYFTEDADQIDKADAVIDTALTSGVDAVVNSPAQAHRAVVQWLAQGSADLALEEGVKLCFWFVSSGEYDSVALFLESLKEFSGVPHVFIRNGFFTDRLTYDFSDPEAHQPIKDALSAHQVPVVHFPRFAPGDLDFVKAHNLTFGEAMSREGGLSIAARSRIKRALNSFFIQLDSLEFFKNEQPKDSTEGKGRRALKSVGGED
ncbi:MAG: mobilization protein [Cyanothece sp. SIO1E1]|nr:mobilization protein [Cyanothece sp. SIO1E1]